MTSQQIHQLTGTVLKKEEMQFKTFKSGAPWSVQDVFIIPDGMPTETAIRFQAKNSITSLLLYIKDNDRVKVWFTIIGSKYNASSFINCFIKKIMKIDPLPAEFKKPFTDGRITDPTSNNNLPNH